MRPGERGQLQHKMNATRKLKKHSVAKRSKAAWLAPIDSLAENQLAPLHFILDRKQQIMNTTCERKC